MDTSKLSRLNHNILKLMLVNLYKSLLEDGNENPKVYDIRDDDVYSSLEYVIKLMGFGNAQYIDVDFLFALYSENYHLIDEDELKINGDLDIPEVTEYTFDVDVDEYVRQTSTYVQRIESYSSDNVIPIFQKAEQDGDVNIFYGHYKGSDVHDNETTDVNYIYNSIRKITK
jgi:hypothetical protein